MRSYLTTITTEYPKMRLANHQRLRCFSVVLGLGLLSLGCSNSNDMETPTRPGRPVDVVPESKEKLSFYTVDHYGEDRNVEDDLKMTIARASVEKKRILLQVGGDWCGWCKLLTAFVEKNEPVRTFLDRNYLLMKVTYTQKQPNEAFLSEYPKIKGYPHLFVLDADGKLLYSQDTSPLEEGNGYNLDRVLAFLEEWKPNKD